MSVAVKRAGLADLDVAAALFDAYRGFYGQPSDRERARRWLEDRLFRDEAVVLLAEIERTAVGFTLLYPMWSSVSTGRVFVLNDLFVAATARRRGVAIALLEAARDHGRSHGALRLVLETARDNLAAQALYRRAGWHDDATQWFSLPLTAN